MVPEFFHRLEPQPPGQLQAPHELDQPQCKKKNLCKRNRKIFFKAVLTIFIILLERQRFKPISNASRILLKNM